MSQSTDTSPLGGQTFPPQNKVQQTLQGDPGNPKAPQGPGPVDTSVNPSSVMDLVINGRHISVSVNARITNKDKQIVKTENARSKNIPQSELFSSVSDEISSIQNWYGDPGVRKQLIQQMFNAGLITSVKNPSAEQVATAWALVVTEASLEGDVTPQQLLAKAAGSGWSSISPQISAADGQVAGSGEAKNQAPGTSSETVYKSYLDPATIMGAQADAWYRLTGRNPTSEEYQAFLKTVYGYQDQENTGKFEQKQKLPGGLQDSRPIGPVGTPADTTGPATATNVVSQRGIGTRGLEFLAGQSAMQNPDFAPYQAATTYFNAFVKALSGPAAGMQASGPTTTAP